MGSGNYHTCSGDWHREWPPEKAAVELGGVSQYANNICLPAGYVIPCNNFFIRICRQAISSRKINDFIGGIFVNERTILALHCFSGPVPDVLTGTSQAIKQA